MTPKVSPTDYHRIGERPLCARGLNRSRGKALWRATEPTQLAHCRAMAAFCRQRVAFENENDAFWIREAEAQSLLLVMAFCQRLGDVFMARAGKGPRKACSYRVEEGTADAPKLAFAA